MVGVPFCLAMTDQVDHRHVCVLFRSGAKQLRIKGPEKINLQEFLVPAHWASLPVLEEVIMPYHSIVPRPRAFCVSATSRIAPIHRQNFPSQGTTEPQDGSRVRRDSQSDLAALACSGRGSGPTGEHLIPSTVCPLDRESPGHTAISVKGQLEFVITD
jgi:hypothetical protein